MTVEHMLTHEGATLAEAMIDQATEQLAAAIDSSPDPEVALERVVESLEQHGHDISKVVNEEAKLPDPAKDWHNGQHTWALVANRVLDAKLLRPTIPRAVQFRIIDRMLAHDEHWSMLTHDVREPDEKDIAYWRDRLKTIQRPRH